MRTVLGIIGLGLVIINIRLVIIRIRESQKTTELTLLNLEESQKTNYLNDLNRGVDMLYSDSFVRQRRGVVHIHNIAEAHKRKY